MKECHYFTYVFNSDVETFKLHVVVYCLMAPSRIISQATINSIWSLHKAGFGAKRIVEETGVAKRTVERWLKRCREAADGGAPEHLPKCGRPRKCNTKTLHLIKRQLNVTPTSTARELKENNPALLSDVSVRSVQRYVLRDLGLVSRSPAVKPLLTPRHIKKRLTFAKEHKDWPLQRYRSILWSDESVFTVTGTNFGKVRRPRNSDRHDPRYTVTRERHPDSLMVWGCFSYYGVGNLVFFEKGVTVNSERYLDLLHDNLETCFDKCSAETFMQDGAPCHRATVVKEWLDMCAVPYLDWPPNSPDLNPIENLWSIMKRKVQEVDTSSVAKLKAALSKLWEELPKELLENLADSFPNRLQEVIHKRGNAIKY